MALEFHKWRDQFPGWFQSQFGNKLIYTGAGAADIVLSSRMNLPGKIQVRLFDLALASLPAPPLPLFQLRNSLPLREC